MRGAEKYGNERRGRRSYAEDAEKYQKWVWVWGEGLALCYRLANPAVPNSPPVEGYAAGGGWWCKQGS